MKFSRWPYWVRGGIIGLTTALVWFVVYMYLLWKYFTMTDFLQPIATTISTMLWTLPAFLLVGWIPADISLLLIISGILNFILLVGVGTFIGWLYGKLKNRKKKI